VIRCIRSNAVLPALLLAALLPAAGLGCGSGRPPTARVEGEVTVAGRPLPTGRIIFYPAEGRSATGAIEPDGGFRLTTYDPGDGALLGEHVVTVTAMQVTGTAPRSFEEELRGQGMETGEARWLIDPKYGRRETSPLRATVERGGNRFRFDLEPPPR